MPFLSHPDLLRLGQHRASLHEVLAEPGQASAATGFALALATGPGGTAVEERATTGATCDVLWLRQEAARIEAGDLHGPGLVWLGVDPGRIVLLHLRSANDVLRAGLEAARCPALTAAIIEMCEPIDLTSSRRLKLAAERSGVTVILVRQSGAPLPNAARTRWRVGAAPARAGPGRPVLAVTLLKHPAGLPEMRCVVEWDRDRREFAPLSGSVGAVPVRRSLAA